MLANWKFTEETYLDDDDVKPNFGSGYPSDPICVKWLERHLSCPVFGYPDVVRFTWGPVKKSLSKRGAKVEFVADKDEEDEEEQYSIQKQREQMSIFLGKAKSSSGGGGGAGSATTFGRKRKRYSFFERKGLGVVDDL